MATVNGVNGVNGTKLPNGTVSKWQKDHKLKSHFYGGTTLATAPEGKVKDFVRNSDGHSVITNVS